MKIIVAYDIVDNRRRLKMRKFLRELGLNTQKSVFECDVEENDLAALRRYAAKQLNLKEDQLAIYHLCAHCAARAEIQGQGIKIVQQEYQVL